MKKIILFTLVLSMVMANLIFESAHAEEDIKVVINNKQIEFDVSPYIKNDRTLVPFRKILEAFGAKVEWNAEQQVVSAMKNTTEIYLKIGVNYAFVNSETIALDAAPEVSNDRTFVPLRFISENLGAEVVWNNDNKTVSILYNDTLYKLADRVTYKDTEISIEKVENDVQTGGLSVLGKINANGKKVKLEVADDYGYILPGDVEILDETDGFYKMKASVSLPSCHDFQAKYIVVKIQNGQNKWVKAAEYQLEASNL